MINTLLQTKAPGIAFTLMLAIPAWYLGKLCPLVGGPVFGILLGMLAAFWHRPAHWQAGISFTAKQLLQASIILLGFEMNLFQVMQVGTQSLYVMLFTLAAAFVIAWLAGRWLSLPGNTCILIGVGTAICGGSAIAATAPVIRADEQDVAYSISTIFLFNIAAVFLFPLLGHLFAMSDQGFGMWAGTAINDTSSVVAAGFSYSQEAGHYATIVKLTRTLMIIPVTLVLATLTARRAATGSAFTLANIFPWFVLWFVVASLITTSGLLPDHYAKTLTEIGKFLIIAAMTAIGLNTHLKKLLNNGLRPILLGLACWLAVAVVSLYVQHLLKQW